MLFKHAAYGDERAFLTVKNVEATSITTGMGVALRIGTAASFDGTQAVRATSANAGDLPGFLGIATKDIPSNTVALIQCFGAVASVFLSVLATSITITSGDPLVPGGAPGGFASAVPTYAASGFCWVIASNVPTNTLSQAAPLYASGFIRALK